MHDSGQLPPIYDPTQRPPHSNLHGGGGLHGDDEDDETPEVTPRLLGLGMAVTLDGGEAALPESPVSAAQDRLRFLEEALQRVDVFEQRAATAAGRRSGSRREARASTSQGQSAAAIRAGGGAGGGGGNSGGGDGREGIECGGKGGGGGGVSPNISLDMSWPDLPGASTPSIVGSNSDASSARDELMTSRASTRNGSRRNASLHSHQSSLWTHRQSPVPQYSASKANWGCIAGADGEKDAVGWEVKTKPGRDVVETGEDEVIDDIDVDDLRQAVREQMRTALTEAGGLVGNLKEADEQRQMDQGGDILVIDENDRDDEELDSDEEEEREKRERKRRGSLARRSSLHREYWNMDPKSLRDCTRRSVPYFGGGFSRKSPIRAGCFRVYKSGVWNAFFVFVTISNCVYIAVGAEFGRDDTAAVGSTAGELFDFACIGVLLFEIFCGVVSLGLYEPGNSYIKISNYHKLDLIVILVTASEFVLASYGIRGLTLRPFRLLRVFRAITSIKAFGGVKAIITTLFKGSGQLLTVLAMLIFFMSAFAIAGMSIFGLSFRRRCVTIERAIPACTSDFDSGWGQTCNFTKDARGDVIDGEWGMAINPGGDIMMFPGYPWEQYCKQIFLGDTRKPRWERTHIRSEKMDATYPYDPVQGIYHSCQLEDFKIGGNEAVWQTCVEVGNPSNGFSHFDHVGGAMLSVAQGVAPDGYYDIIWRSIMSEPDTPEGLIWLLYIIITCICTFLLLGLFVAVVTGTFAQVREAEGSSGFVRAPSADGDDDDDGIDWINNGPYSRDDPKQMPVGDNTASIGMLMKIAIQRRQAEQDAKLQKLKLTSMDESRDEEDNMPEGEAVLQKMALEVLLNPWFTHFFSIVILVHCTAMSSDQYDSDEQIKLWGYWAYIICNILFVLELGVRFAACDGIPDFWSHSFNRLELLNVIMGLLGLATYSPFMLRLPSLRIYRLMCYFPTLEALLYSAVASTAAILNLCLFITVVALSFAIAGRYIFGSDMNEWNRSNFGTFQESLLTTFQLLTGDSWSAVVYSAMASKEGTFAQGFVAIFILSWFTFSNLIINNLFVAVIIENFEVSETIANIAKPGYLASAREMVGTAYGQLFKSFGLLKDHNLVLDHATGRLQPKKKLDYHFSKMVRVDEKAKGAGGKSPPKFGVRPKEKKEGYGGLRTSIQELIARVSVPYDMTVQDEEEEEREVVLGCFGPTNSVRKFFTWLGKQHAFDLTIFAAIIISCIFLMLAPPNDDLMSESLLSEISTTNLKNVNRLFTILFTAEFFTKIMSQGLIFTPNAYLKSGWNVMDSVVLAFAWVDETGILQNSSAAKVVRLARALRPLRLMKRNKGMRVVIDALISTLAPVIYVIIFALFTFTIAAIMGMGLFGGKFYRCSTPGAEFDPQTLTGGKAECSGFHISDGSGTNWVNGAPKGVMVPRSWINAEYNFDSIFRSFFTLYRVNTIKYVQVIHESGDLTLLDSSPYTGYSEFFQLFFVIYLVVGGLFVMNLFVGFIVDGFNANKGSTQAEIYYNRFLVQLMKHKPKREYFKEPRNGMSSAMRNFVTSDRFTTASATSVMANVVFMLADHADASSDFTAMMDVQNTVFYGLLLFEILLNTIAYGPGGFYNDGWKGFDLLVAVGTTAGYAGNNASLSQFAKSFRLMRVIRLMKMIGPIRIILETMLQSIPQLANILLLIMLVYSMFAVVFVSSYGTVKYGYRLGPTLNFGDYGSAITACYQLITGDEWMDVMTDCAVQPPFCTPLFNKSADPYYDGPELSFGDCGSEISRPWFLIFKLVCESVMLNLFIGMILDNFSFITDEVAHVEDSEWSMGASKEQVMCLADVFKQFDCGTSFVPESSLHALLCTMEKPLGYRDDDGNLDYTPADRLIERFIRGELRVILRGEMEAQAKEEMRLFYPIIKVFKDRKTFHGGVGFNDLVLTLLYWRLPEMVPRQVKELRRDRVEEAVLMTHAIAIADFFHSLVAYRKSSATRSTMHQRISFREWAISDPHFLRRLEEVSAIKAEERRVARKRGQTWVDLQIQPSRSIFIDMRPLDIVPHDLLTHMETVAHLKSIRPSNGLDSFLAYSKKAKVVLKFVDGRNQQKGLVYASFEQVDWTGWLTLRLACDSLYVPLRRRKRREQKPKPWTRVDCRMQTRESDRLGVRLNKWKDLGVLLDIQSCAFATEFDQEHDGRPINTKSIVRINIGTMRDLDLAPSTAKQVKPTAKLWHDGVLEVVGYTNMTLKEIEDERSHRLTLLRKSKAIGDDDGLLSPDTSMHGIF